MSTRYTTEEFIEAVESSLSVREVLEKLRLAQAGGNYLTVRNRVKELGLDTSHFRRVSWNKGKKIGRTSIPLSEILVEESTYMGTSRLKIRLFKEGLKDEVCENCGLTEWFGSPIPLELHHENGIRQDNRIDNIRILCPNCHALTDNYRGKNIKTTSEPATPPRICVDCEVQISRYGNVERCLSCAAKQRPTKIEWPPVKEIKMMVNETSYLAVAKKLGVSDNAVRKYLRRNGIDPKTRKEIGGP